MLVQIVSIYFDKLLENSSPAAGASDSKARRVVEVTEDFAVVLVVAVLRPKNRGTNGARKVFYVELFP